MGQSIQCARPRLESPPPRLHLVSGNNHRTFKIFPGIWAGQGQRWSQDEDRGSAPFPAGGLSVGCLDPHVYSPENMPSIVESKDPPLTPVPQGGKSLTWGSDPGPHQGIAVRRERGPPGYSQAEGLFLYVGLPCASALAPLAASVCICSSLTLCTTAAVSSLSLTSWLKQSSSILPQSTVPDSRGSVT